MTTIVCSDECIIADRMVSEFKGVNIIPTNECRTKFRQFDPIYAFYSEVKANSFSKERTEFRYAVGAGKISLIDRLITDIKLGHQENALHDFDQPLVLHDPILKYDHNFETFPTVIFPFVKDGRLHYSEIDNNNRSSYQNNNVFRVHVVGENDTKWTTVHGSGEVARGYLRNLFGVVHYSDIPGMDVKLYAAMIAWLDPYASSEQLDILPVERYALGPIPLKLTPTGKRKLEAFKVTARKRFKQLK